MRTLRIGDVVRIDDAFENEGTVVEVGEKGAYVRWNVRTDQNGWFNSDELRIVRGTKPPEERAPIEIRDVEPLM